MVGTVSVHTCVPSVFHEAERLATDCVS
jgi:hypothetical protein